jgi:hypothetical protein
MRQKNVNAMLIQELSPDGLGKELIYESKDDKDNLISVKNFLSWLNIELHGLAIIVSLINDFNQIELLEHYNDYYKIRVPRQNKSIGYVFG